LWSELYILTVEPKYYCISIVKIAARGGINITTIQFKCGRGVVESVWNQRNFT